ncbi:MAG TPA: hypothetical protein VNL35_12700 [Chloroflexota bacterium]|nr:hypothetical protein [Chloroflexota bacterium]
MHVFRLVERVLARSHTLHPLGEGGILRYEIAPLPVPAIGPRGGELIRRGDPCVILHFDNPTLAALSAGEPNVRRLTWRLTRLCARDLDALAQLARQGVIPAEIQAIWAETLVYQALRRWGFATRLARPTIRTPFARLFMLAILAIYGRPRQLSHGGRALDHLRLGEAWIDINDLLERFPPREYATPAPHSGRHRRRPP